jgi:CheY-like chemotaxis protein
VARPDGQSPAAQAFAKYISTKQVLIADPNGASRAGVARMMSGFGVKTANLWLAADYNTAIEMIREKKPTVILTEYFFSDGSGLELCKAQREAGIEARDGFFIILTNDSSQSAVAQAAEEDVDCYILKPYTIESFKEKIIAAAAQKFTPSPYFDLIYEGKKQLGDKKIDEALTTFGKAVGLSPKPSLAMAYLGQAERIKALVEQAEKTFKEGLKFNPIHYKCMIGLFDVLLEQNKLEDAYTVLTSISKVFPTNPNRLAQTVRLIVLTKNYQEIDSFYEAFKQLEFRTPALVKICCAALITCGKHSLKNADRQRGCALLLNAAVSAAGNPPLLKEIVLIFTEFGRFDEAGEVLNRFPMDTRPKDDYLIAEYILEDRRKGDPLYSIHNGRKLVQAGLKNLLVYRALIQALVTAGKNDEVEDCMVEVNKLWPDQKAAFLSLVK